MSQEQLAERMHVSREAVSRLERGRRTATIDLVTRAFRAMGIQIRFEVTT
jgi:transcriptional regulator with XRE-family HTH domain